MILSTLGEKVWDYLFQFEDLAMRGALPGPAANYRASIVSLSADKTVQVSLFNLNYLSFPNYIYFLALSVEMRLFQRK